MISASKCPTFLKQKNIKTAEKEPYLLVGEMAGSVLHYILDWEACEFHCCTMRLYWKHRFIYQKLTGSYITYICIFHCYAEAFFEYFFL